MFFEFVQVGDRIEVAGRLFGAETTVKVAADGAMISVAGELADVVDMICRVFDFHQARICFAAFPPGIKHPCVECGADDRVSRNKIFDLFVGELAFSRNERAAVVMAGDDRTVVNIQRVCERFVGKMSDIEDHADAPKFFKQAHTGIAQWTVGGGAARVLAASVMGRTDGTQTFVEPGSRFVPAAEWDRRLPSRE